MVVFIYFAQVAVGLIFGHDDATMPSALFGGAPITKPVFNPKSRYGSLYQSAVDTAGIDI